MLDPLVCPDCGNAEVQRDASASLRLTGYYYPDGLGFDEYGEERLDIERDFDTLECTDCGAEHAPEDLVTEDTYNGSED